MIQVGRLGSGRFSLAPCAALQLVKVRNNRPRSLPDAPSCLLDGFLTVSGLLFGLQAGFGLLEGLPFYPLSEYPSENKENNGDERQNEASFHRESDPPRKHDQSLHGFVTK